MPRVFVHVYQSPYGDLLRVCASTPKPATKTLIHGHRVYSAASVHPILDSLDCPPAHHGCSEMSIEDYQADAIPGKTWPAFVSILCSKTTDAIKAARLRAALNACLP